MRRFEKVSFAQFLEHVLDASLRDRPFELDTRNAFSREYEQLQYWLDETKQQLELGVGCSVVARVSLHNDMLFAYVILAGYEIAFVIGSRDE